MILLDSVTHHHLVALVERAHIPAVAMNHLVNMVAQTAVTVECIAHVQHLVLAVQIHIGHANLVSLCVAILVVVFPLLH